MPDNIVQSTQYTIKTLSIVSKIGTIDITGMFEELNIFDSIFNACMTGNVLIKDSIGLSNKLSFDGSEILIVDLGKTERDATLKKSFRIYKQSSRKSIKLTAETYLLHFVSDEFILSQQTKIPGLPYDKPYSEVVRSILKEYLGVENQMVGVIENSIGVRKFIVPYWSPIDAIDWCAKRAVNEDNSPTFLFFENKIGYNFVTLSYLLSRKPVHHINFQPKNLNFSDNELMGTTYYEVISQFDMNKAIKSGMYAGKFVGFDTATGTVVEKLVDYNDIYGSNQHANKAPNIGVVINKAGIKSTEMFNSRRVVYPTGITQSSSDWIKTTEPESINYDDDTYNYIFQREASLRTIMGQRLKVVMPGNFDLTSGLTASLLIPNRSENDKSIDSVDKTLTGKYLIVATRHIISFQKHETIIEVATDTNTRDNYFISSPKQNEAVKAYG